MSPNSPGRYARPRCLRRPVRRRRGQAMIEVAAGLIVFLVVMMAAVDTGWLMYHQIAVTQAVKLTSRYASTNLNTQADISAEFYRLVGPTMIDTGNSSVNISTTTTDATFASVSKPSGEPSVTVRVQYNHGYLGPWPWVSSGYTIDVSARSRVFTWTEQPTISF